jgi:hypothetical protein
VGAAVVASAAMMVAGLGRARVVPACRPSVAVPIASAVLVMAPLLVASTATAVTGMALVTSMLVVAPVTSVLVVATMAPVPGIRAPVALAPLPMGRRGGLHGGCRSQRDGGSKGDPRDRHGDHGGRARDQGDLRGLRMRRAAGPWCLEGRVGHRADIGADGAAEVRQQAACLRHRQRECAQNDVHGCDADPKRARGGHAARPPRYP